MASPLITRTRRSFAFARHMPVSKLVRRFELNVKRRLRDRFHAEVGPAPQFARVETPPLPLFEPRARAMPEKLEDGRLCFSFVGRSVDLDPDAMDWTAPGPGPEAQLWRMNLHYMEYLETVDDALWARLVSSWIAVNGAGGRKAWRDSWNSYALSLRIVVWLQELARRRDRLPEGLVIAVEDSTLRQIRFLVDNLETDLGGNHLIKNIKALIWASAYFSGPAAARWRTTALDLLRPELTGQILPDGVHYERSPSYHLQVFADLLECRAALGGDLLGGALDDALTGMAQATADLVHPDGDIAQFNDAGLNMTYAPDECLTVYAGLGFAVPKPRARFAFPDAGYFGMRAGGTYFICDCGDIAPDDLPAHGHGDVLSFEWSVGGHRIIVDQGVYEYVEGPRRAASRSASRHNTLCFEGADQADFFGAFRCGRRPRPLWFTAEEREGAFVFEGSHDGFANLPGRPIHRRRFEVRADRIRITDRIDGDAGRPAKIGFLVHPDVLVSRTGGHEVLLTVDGQDIRVSASHAMTIEPAVWWPDMGVEHLTSRVSVAVPAGAADVEVRLDVTAETKL